MLSADFLDWVLVGAGGVYGGLVMWLSLGVRRCRSGAYPGLPAVSVIIAARNEEEYIGDCLASLQAQCYSGPWEVVVVDDRSEDSTGQIVEKIARTWDRLLLVRASSQMTLRCPKKNALAQGIAAASGEVLLFTDADCKPPPRWIAALVAQFSPEIGLVAGYACSTSSLGWCQKILSLDNLAIGALGSGSMGMGIPLSCSGRSLAYRKKVYEEVGGFTDIGHLMAGDDVYFMRLVTARTDWIAVYERSADSVVKCSARPSGWRTLLNQKLRHAGKGGNYCGWAFLLGVVVYLFHLVLLISLGRLALGMSTNCLPVLVWGCRWLLDGVWLWSSAFLPGERRLLAALPFVELLYIPYVLVFTPLGALGRFHWR